jgi:hypothetical protein
VAAAVAELEAVLEAVQLHQVLMKSEENEIQHRDPELLGILEDPVNRVDQAGEGAKWVTRQC